MSSRFIESLNLDGVIESVNSDLYSLRRQMIKGNVSGLGPPDLIMLTKKTDNPEFPTVKSYHSVSGLTISGPSSFAAYFSTLTNLIPKSILGTPKYSLVEGTCYCWNAFANVDIQITVQNPGSCEYSYNSDKQVYVICEQTWRELHVCSSLRFWRASEPLFAMLFGNTPIAAPACRLLVPEALSLDDIRYAITELPPSPDADVAIANALIATKNRAQTLALLRELATFSPRLLSIIMKYIPINSPSYPEFASFISECYMAFPDDVQVACAYVDVNITKGSINKCQIVAPLLIASMWRDPQACISLARISMAQGKSEDAIFFLNAACYAREQVWSNPIINLPTYQTTKSKKFYKTDVSQTEQLLCASHFCGPTFNFYRCLAELARDVGIIKLQTMMKYKSFTAKNIVPTNPEMSYYNESKMDNDNTLDLRNIPLFDPGISSTAQPPVLISFLPTSSKLITAAEYIIKDLSTIETMKRQPQLPTPVDAVRAALTGIRVGDMEIVEIALKSMKSVSLLSDLIRMRMLCESQWRNLSCIFHDPPKNSSLNEVNAAFMAKTISLGLESFII